MALERMMQGKNDTGPYYDEKRYVNFATILKDFDSRKIKSFGLELGFGLKNGCLTEGLVRS